MSSGTITSGSISSGIYYTRSWDGADGRDKVNPYTMSSVTFEKRPGYYRSTKTSPTCSLALNINPIHAVELWDNNDDIALLGKLAGKIKGHTFDLGTTAATAPQAVRQAASTIAAIAGSLSALKKGDISKALKSLGLSPGQRRRKQLKRHIDAGDVSGAWLAMQYGWLPTLSDVYEGWKAIEKHENTRGSSMTFFASRRRRNEKTGTNNSTKYISRTVRRKSISYTLYAEPSLGSELGLTDPASILWEVMPWSFAIDWFIPIGDYLDLLGFIPSLKGRGFSTSKLTVQTSSQGWVQITDLNQGCPAPRYFRKSVSFSRTVTSGLSVPHPVFRAGLKGKRIANAVALAHQVLRRFD